MKTRLSKMLACLFAGILTATAADYSVFAATPSTLEYYVCPNTKILKENEDEYSGLTKNGKLLFSAAANERESGQIILTGSGTHTITLALNGDLSDGKGNTIKEENFEIYFEHYVYEREFGAIIDYGSYPDALIPQTMAREIGANKIEFNSNKTYSYIDPNDKTDKEASITKKNQGIWFTLTVPKETPAGIYTGKLTGSLNVDVEVQVFDFELPDKTQSVEWLEVHAYDNCKGAIPNTTGIQPTILSDGKSAQDENIQYLKEMNTFLDKRKITSGHCGSVVEGITPGNLTAYVNAISVFVKNNKAPYYDITVDYSYTKPPIDVTENQDFMKALDNDKTEKDDEVFNALYEALRAGTENYFNKNEKTTIKTSLDNEEKGLKDSLNKFLDQYYKDKIFNYKQLPKDYNPWISSNLTECLRGNQGDCTAPMYCYLYSSLAVISKDDFKSKWNKDRCGVNTILKAIVDRSIDTDNYDLLQYAFLKIPYVDEPCAWLISDNLQTLLNAHVFEQCKKETIDYINKKSCNNTALKNSLLKSCENLMMIFTTTPTSKTESYVVAHRKTERVYTAIQYKGLNDKTIFDVDKVLLKGEYDAKTHKFKTKYKNNDKDIELDEGFYNKYYCPLFTDFSYSNLAEAQDIETTWNALKTDNITMWWYSCTSARNAGNAGFRLNQNRGKIDSGKEITMDPLAVKRANKWQQFQMGIRGEHFWAVDDSFGKTEPDNPNRNVSQWGKVGNENLLVYPIKQYLKNVCGLNDEKYESDLNQKANNYGYFMSTLRLENEAEANDDYDYLCLAKQLAENYPEYQDKINSIIQLIIKPDNVDYTDKDKTNSTNLMLARTQLAALIEGRISNAKVITNEKENDYIKLSDYGIGNGIQNWKKSQKALCFDVFQIDRSKEGTASFVLNDNDFHNLSDVIWINFSSQKINNSAGEEIEGASLVSKENGWYQVVLPLGNTPTNKDKDPNGIGTMYKLYFASGNVTSPILVDNFKVVTEISGEWKNEDIKLSDYKAPIVSNWKSSNKVLCFDVIETGYQKKDCSKTAKIILTDDKGSPLSDILQLDFTYQVIYHESKKLDDALFVKKDNGWYQVILPLNAVPEKNSGGQKTLCKVHFKQQDVFRSFGIDNVKVLTKIPKIANGNDNYVKLSDYDIQSISNWKSSNKSLCFDVFNKKQQGTASVLLTNSIGTGLSDVLKIDFSAKTITKYYGDDKIGALLVDKGKGRYQVILPLGNTPTNKDKDPNGIGTMYKLYFAPNNISVPFLIVDNVKLKMT